MTPNKFYIICNDNLYLKKVYHYGYTTNNKPIFKASFTTDVLNAKQFFTYLSANNCIDKFKSEDYFIENNINISVLNIKEISACENK